MSEHTPGQFRRALRPDAQAFDEIRIVTVPRYKMSGLSGDEWRISAKIQLLRKGRVIHEDSYRNVETAARLLDTVVMKAIDDGKAFYAGEGDWCDQEGCSDEATVTLRRKDDFCSSCGKEQPPSYLGRTIHIRRFCAKHSKRGDCGIDDADRNYEVISGKVGMPPEEDMSPSATVTIEVDSVDEIPLKLAEWKRQNNTEGRLA